MAIDQDITNLPTPPSRSDSPSDFSDKADAFLAALPQLQTELNTYADEANATQQVINTSESNAATSETNAEDWASKTDGIVLTTDYSAKAYAISDNLIPEGAAKEWAIKIGGTVDGTDFSAKKYANDAQSSADAAASLAGATAWSAGVTYDTNDAAIGSDGNTYRSLVDGNLGNDPVAGDGTKWLNLTGTADVTKAELTKTFAAGESANLTLSEEVTTAPVVSVTKEIPQTGVTSNDWDVASDGANYTLHDTAYDTTLTPDEIGYLLDQASYDSLSFDVSGQSSQARGMTFNNDGTKFYTIDASTDRIYQYSLNTPFDINTASYDNISRDVGAQDGNPFDVVFNNDGTKLYMLGFDNSSVYQHSLSTPFDLSSASYNNVSFSMLGQESNVRSIAFNDDGTKLYMVGFAGSVYEYNLNTAFDLSSASYNNVSFDISSQITKAQGMAFNNDGTEMYVVDDETNSVYGYTLSTAFDLSTASYDSVSFDVSGQDGIPFDIQFNNDGTKMYMVGGSVPNSVYQYSTSKEALVLGTGSFASTDVGKRIVGNGGEAILTATDGSYEEQTAFNDSSTIAAGDWSMFALDVESAAAGLTLSGVETISSFVDVSEWSYDGVVLDGGNEERNPSGITFNNTGSKMYTLGGFNDNVNQYSLTTPFDLSTASYDNISFSVAGEILEPRGFQFSNDGTKMFVVGQSADAVFQYSLNTPFDISTASYDNLEVPVSGNDTIDLAFNSDGTKMFILDLNVEQVDQYSLSTAFDVSNISQDNASFSVSAQGKPFSFEFNNDGTKMYILFESTTGLFQYSLSTAFDISTASYDNLSFDVSGQDTGPQGFTFNNDGTKMYLGGAASFGEIFQYSTGSVNNFIPTSTNHTAITSASTDTEFWTDINSMTADDASNDGSVYYAVSTDDRTTWSIVKDAVANETETLAVTVATGTLYQGGGSQGNVFYIEGNENPPLGLTRGNTYVFDQSDASNSNHPLRFQLTDGTSYTDGVTTNGTPGSAGANTTFVVPNDAPDNLEYYCSVHGIGMGGPVDVHDVRNAREIARDDSGQWQVNDASGYLTEIWVPTTENDEFYALEEAVDVSTAQSVDGYDLSSASYDNVSFDFSTQESGDLSLRFNNDGTKLYIVGFDTDTVYEYDLSTPFDVSTSSYNNASFSVSSQMTVPAGLSFNNDGSRFYVGDSNGIIFQYSLTVNFDVTTASYDNVSLSIPSGGFVTGLDFNQDGSKMYVVDPSTDSLIQYSLTTAFDISTASLDNDSLSLSSQNLNMQDVFVSDDGTKIFVIGDNPEVFVYMYELSIPYDLNSASYSGDSFDISNESTDPRGIAFNNDGNKMIIGTSGGSVYQYTTGSTTSTNRMDATQLNAVSDGNHYTLGDDLDLAITLFMADGNTNSPTSDGVSINYDANVVNQGAVLGTDYEFDKPTNTTVRVTALSDENLKVRVL